MRRRLSRKNQRRRATPRSFWLWLSMSALLFFAAWVSLPLYTPVVHHWFGDWTGGFSPKIAVKKNQQWTTTERLQAKVMQENGSALLNLFELEDVPLHSELPSYRLEIPQAALHQLNQDILRFHHGELERKPRTKAFLLDDTRGMQKVTVAYRGANTWHHQTYKPSLKIRLPKSSLLHGHRDHVLMAPEDPIAMRNALSGHLAATMGLLHLDETAVRVFLNQRFLGVYTRVWRMNESLLIQKDQLPGLFFRLEDFTGPAFKPNRATFGAVSSWEIIGGERASGEPVVKNLAKVLSMSDLEERAEMLRDLIDVKTFARWLALLAHSGEIHIDNHNLALWLSPVSGKLSPVVLDVNGYAWAHAANLKRPVLRAGNKLIDAFLCDPENLALLVKELQFLLDGAGHIDVLEIHLRKMWNDIRPDARADLHTSEMGSLNRTYTRTLYPISFLDENLEEMVSFIRMRNTFLQNNLDLARVVALEEDVSGTRYFVQSMIGVDVEVDGVRQRLGVTRSPQLPLTMPYALHRLPGIVGSVRFFHPRTGKELDVTRQPPANVAQMLLAPRMVPRRPDAKMSAPEVVNVGPGNVEWTSTHRYPAHITVRILPGTHLFLAKDASLIAEGPLLIDGTKSSPVFVRPLDEKMGFGVVAAMGSAKVRIHHFDIEGGGMARFRNLQLSGMLSIHDATDVVVEDVRVGKNRDGDDSIHVVGSKVRFTRVRVEDALADAIDWDQVDGVLEESVIFRSGNDGLDLSMGHVQVESSTFIDCGDKCISVGEGAQVDIHGVDTFGGRWGIAAKDSAVASLQKVNIVDAELGVGLFNKKWRWEKGGEASLFEVSFSDSKIQDTWADSLSIFSKKHDDSSTSEAP
ncbi:MAG: hypothetical protein GY822_07110 [Deltaproteobacteria bacterium]|nr:hypothetical protein [Deltaproteobacteria bacterium]